MLNMHFENVGEDKDFRHDDTYANVNTTLAWNVTKGLKFRLRGGSRCNFGDISNFVTSPIFYTYKDATTKGTFASLMAMITRSRTNSMSQTSVSDGNIYNKVSFKNTLHSSQLWCKLLCVRCLWW